MEEGEKSLPVSRTRKNGFQAPRTLVGRQGRDGRKARDGRGAGLEAVLGGFARLRSSRSRTPAWGARHSVAWSAGTDEVSHRPQCPQGLLVGLIAGDNVAGYRSSTDGQ